jgi:hypothetical protein
MSIPYSAEKDDLYDPAKHAVFFPAGRPKSDAALCAELSRLADCRLETSFGFDQDRIRKVLARGALRAANFSRTQSTPIVRVLIAFLRSKRTTIAPQSWLSSHFAAPIRTILPIGLTISTLGPNRGNSSRAKSTRVLQEALAQVESDGLAALKVLSCRVLLTGHSLVSGDGYSLARAAPREQLAA